MQHFITAAFVLIGLIEATAIQATEITAAELFHRAEQAYAKGRYAEAEPLYKEALTMEERGLGPDRPEIIPVLNALADLYHVQGRNAEAEPVCRRAVRGGAVQTQCLPSR
jgi:tetratricopeptide (TPR) repeat protein